MPTHKESGYIMKNWLNKIFGSSKPDQTVPMPSKLASELPEPPKQKNPITYYSIGVVENHRVSFQMGYAEITLNRQGLDNLIRQLEVFRDQLPVPAPQQDPVP